jgi:hypothetical protein
MSIRTYQVSRVVTMSIPDEYVKVLGEDLCHHGFTYKEGLNVDHHPFSVEPCTRGGLYFCRPEDLHHYIGYGTKIAKVTLPPGAMVSDEGNKLKADRIVLHDIRHITIEEYIAAGRLEYLPMKFMTYEVCCEFVKNARTFLNNVPADYLDENLCKIAIKHGKNLLCLPMKYRTYEICELGIQNDPWSMFHVPKGILDSKLCLLAVCLNPLTFDHVPKRFRTKKMYEVVIKSGSYDIHDIPPKYLPKELKILL